MIYAGNFKSNHTRKSTEYYLKALAQKLGAKQAEDKVYIFPPLTAIDHYEGDFTLGVQNAYPTHHGAFTGEIGLEQLDEFDIKTILLGHSERREHLGESQADISKKFAFFQDQDFEIVYCIGEPLAIREKGFEAVMQYLLAQFEGIDIGYENLIVAYEPIWAIGTGRSATVEEISSTHRALKKVLKHTPLLYGGSAKPSNIKEIKNIAGVDGVLVGSASLETESFLEMILS
ncbi:MAG: triose-phosphate isomerase [Sulfurovum sp.]|nr:triose-phosphate isomerase [Sulfurovum sp.]